MGRISLPGATWRAVGLLLASAILAQTSDTAVKRIYETARQRAQELLVAGQHEPALGVCEAFLRDFPETPPYSRGIAVLANQALSALRATGPDGAAKTLEHSRRITTEFADAPEYYALGLANVARDLIMGPDPARRDPAAGETMLREALERLGDRLPRDYYLGYNLLILRIQALRHCGRLDEARAWATESAESSPQMLSDRGFLRAVYDVARVGGDAAETLSAAKLYWLLCDYAQEPMSEAMELVTTALHGAQGPGAVTAFGRAQEDLGAANPLREAAVWPVGDRERLAAAAGTHLGARLNVHLAFGELREALAVAKEELRRSTGRPPREVAQALRDLARVFRAHDLSVVRANAFLSFHETGEGENPLPDLEDELRAGAGP